MLNKIERGILTTIAGFMILLLYGTGVAYCDMTDHTMCSLDIVAGLSPVNMTYIVGAIIGLVGLLLVIESLRKDRIICSPEQHIQKK